MWLCLIGLAACGNGRGSLEEGAGSQSGFTIGGTVTGLSGAGLVLQNNAGNDLALSANGTFSFTGTLTTGTAYAVTVLTQPANPAQTCTVTNGTGTVATSNITSVAVTCTTGTFPIGGNVSGLVGTGLVLQNNGGDDLAIAGDGGFTFVTPIATGAPYNVTVKTQPANPTQTCTVTNGTGSVQGAVTNVAVTCATTAFTVGGSVSGLSGSGLVLQNNGTEDLPIAGNGAFAFVTAIASGAPYNVTVKTQPSNPLQTCAVANGTGTVSNASITNVAISCTTSLFTIGGTVTGLAGTGLVLQVNGGDDRAINMNGPFTFPTAVPQGTRYSVSVRTSPSNPSQTCTITNGTGTVTAAVTNVLVTCRTDTFQVGGTVNGLDGTGLVLQNNGADDLSIASNGSFTFARELTSGTQYHVTVRSQPVNKSQTCTVANATGTVGNGDVRNVRVTCATNTYSVGGTVTGLVGHNLVLRNNSDDIGVDSDGKFTFPREIASGGNYNVTVQRQPDGPTQACSVANGSGTVTSADITNVTVTCVTSQFSIGGSVSGLTGTNTTPLVLSNNGVEALNVQFDGVFTFPTPLLSGSAYSVTVQTPPTGPIETCMVTNGSGTVGGANVTNISVNCIPIGFSVGGSVSGLAGRNLVIQNNGDELAIAADGPFKLPDTLTPGTPYNISVRTQPDTPTQLCLVANGAGTIGQGDVTNIAITCTTVDFSIGGTVKGLHQGPGSGEGLILQNNGSETLLIVDDGPFIFAIPIPSGQQYAITIAAQPTDRGCIVSNGAGTVTDHDVTDAEVACDRDEDGGA
jgi:hypothetical protein